MVSVYDHFVKYRSFTIADIAYVAAERKAQSKLHDDLKTQQKQVAKTGDYEAARAISDEAKEALKRYRAACLVLGYCMGNPPGDSPYIPMVRWSIDLVEELDALLYYLELHHAWEPEDALQELDYAVQGMLARFNSHVAKLLE